MKGDPTVLVVNQNHVKILTEKLRSAVGNVAMIVALKVALTWEYLVECRVDLGISR